MTLAENALLTAHRMGLVRHGFVRTAAVAAFAREHDPSAPALAAIVDDATPDGKEPPPALRDVLARLAELARGLRAELAFDLTVDSYRARTFTVSPTVSRILRSVS
jgi:hypothetical protein